MRRRDVVAGIVVAVLSRGTAARAQQPSKAPRIGMLAIGSRAEEARTSQIFLGELQRLGWIDGQSVAIDWRASAGDVGRYDALAAELVRAEADVIVAPNPNALFAARRATSSIPIVMVNTPDPVELGIVASLARPGGKVTGTSTLSADLSLKQLQLVAELRPGLARLAVLSNAANPWHANAIRALGAAARALGIELAVVTVNDADDYERRYAELALDRIEAVLVLADPLASFHRASLTELALRHHLPTAYGAGGHAQAGGLMSYWADTDFLWRRSAAYVDKLLKGAKPGDLPIEQPTKYELVINLRTARALGIEVPASLLARADEVIE